MPKISSVFVFKALGFLCLMALLSVVPVREVVAGDFLCNGKKVSTSDIKTCVTFAECAVCEATDTTWSSPKIGIAYNQVTGGDKYKEVADGECEWMGGAGRPFAVRFCARKAQPGENGNTSTDKVMLCGYEDWLDGTDISAFSSPNHKGSKNMVVQNDLGCVDLPIAKGPPQFKNDAWKISYLPNPEIKMGVPSTFVDPEVDLNICEDANANVARCVPGQNSGYANGITLKETLIFKPAATNSFVVSKTAGDGRVFEARITTSRPDKICIYKTQEPDGTVVETLQGCVSRPGYMPAPTVSVGNSTTNLPKITAAMAGETKTIEMWVNPNDYDTNSAAAVPHECDYLNQIEFCAYRPCSVTKSDGTCATWSDKMCLSGYETAPLVVVGTATDTAIPVGQNPPGNVSKTANTSFVNNSAFNEVNANGALYRPSMTLKKTVSVYNPPLCYQKDTKTGDCLNYESDSTALNLIVRDFGVCCTDSTCSGIPKPYTDSNGKCLQYVRNTPITNGAHYDPYKIDSTISSTTKLPLQTARPLSGEEMGLCVSIPQIWIQDKPGNYTYVAPSGCSTATVELWGGGGGGRNGSSSNDDWSGGAGGYVKASVPVTAGSSYSVIVGVGGVPFGGGGISSFASQSEVKVLANSGMAQIGGNSFCANGATCITQKKGNDGTNNDCGLMAGAGAWDPDQGAYTQWKEQNVTGTFYTFTHAGGVWTKLSSSSTRTGPSGVWQCDDSDDYDSHDLHIADLGNAKKNNVDSNFYYPSMAGVGGCSSDKCSSNNYNGNVGPGGPGKARITCN